MPELNPDDQTDDLPEGDEPEGEAPDEGGEPKGDEPESGKPKGDPEKRISDLQSKLDRETARANKAERDAKSSGKSGEPGNDDPERKAWMQELREAGLDAVYADFPDLREYGIERSLIEGSSRAEMRESATSVVALIKSVSTKTRNKVLAEHGIKAEPAGATRKPPVDFNSMPQDEFEKYLDGLSL